MSMDYIRSTYGVPAKRGLRVNVVFKAIWDALPGNATLADVTRATDAVLAALDGLPDTPTDEGRCPSGASQDDDDDFPQCPHEVIRATCIGACRCGCEACAPFRDAAHPVADAAPAPAARPETDEPLRGETVRLCRGYVSNDEGQVHNEPLDEYVVPVVIDPSLDTLGRTNREARFDRSDTTIVLREWDEQVLLHEVLHVLFDRWLIPEAGPHGHKAIALAEVALWLAGYRRRSGTDTAHRDTLRRIERLAADVPAGDDRAAWNALGRVEGEARRALAAEPVPGAETQ